MSNTYYYMGKAYALKGDNVLAMQYLEKGVSVSRRFDEWEVRVRIWMEGGRYSEEGRPLRAGSGFGGLGLVGSDACQ